MIYIIGSGLSAMAAATALVQRGCRPTILDPGLSPEPEVLTLKAQLATVAPEEWKSRDLACVKQTGPVAANRIPRKLHFGSDFVFRDLDPPSAVEASQASMHRSFAAGGFSVVWGAVIQPLPPEAMKHWPVTREELKPHYAAVRRLFCDTPEVSGMEPFTEADPITEELRPSSQARALYANLWTYRQHLARSGIRFGYTQHAVRAASHNGNKGCCYCGLCLHGCPYDCKYSAATTLAQLVRHDSVRYLPGLVVDRIRPDNGRIRIEARSLADGEFHSFRGDRVLIAAGLPETSRIILASMGWFDTLFELKHSDIFTLPIIRYSPALRVAREKIHTLCQIVAEIEDAAICSYPIHLQFYGYNDLYQSLMARKMGVCAPLLAPFVRALAVRLFVIFGYLHSGVSSTLSMKLIDCRHPKLELAGKSSAQALIISRAAARKLYQHRRYFQAIPLERLLRLDLPGGGYHTGGIFPMRNEPGAFETDRMGCLASMPAVHIVEMIGSISCHLFLRSVNPSFRISFFLPINRYM